MLRIEMLPARHGDGFWIEYSSAKAPRRVVIDGGPAPNLDVLTDRIDAVGETCPVDLYVVTHIDDDHIGAALALFQDPPPALDVAEVWFNDWRHLPKGSLGAVQGARLAKALDGHRAVWNQAFDDAAVMDDGTLPIVDLPDGAALTLLSPGAAQLKTLRAKWNTEIAEFKKKGGVLGGRKEPFPTSVDMDALLEKKTKLDGSSANGSSIAFLFEYDGTRILFGADAYGPVLLDAIRRMSPKKPLRLDAFKLPHHGSGANVTEELLKAVDCEHFWVSSNGDKFQHPDPEAIARVIHTHPGCTLHFNYRTRFTELWDNAALRKKHRYKTRYPKAGAEGLAFDL